MNSADTGFPREHKIMNGELALEENTNDFQWTTDLHITEHKRFHQHKKQRSLLYCPPPQKPLQLTNPLVTRVSPSIWEMD